MLFALAVVAPQSVAAWQMRDTPICTLSHTGAEAEIVITYDPRLPEYRLVVTLDPDKWDNSPTFGMVFNGPRSLRIGTDRHQLSADRHDLSVADRGFGNVLDGLEFNDRAIAATAGTSVNFDLTDAAPAVRAFRDCARGVPATS